MNETKKGVIALVLLAWVFATMGVFARYLGTSFDLFEQTYLRIALAFLFSCIFFAPYVTISKFFSVSRKDLLILSLRSIFLYLAVVLITQALLTTKFANASLISTLPIMPVLGYILLRETVGLKALAWIGVGFIGAMIISLQGGLQFGKGELLAFASLILFDLSYIFRKKHSNYLNNFESTLFMFAVGSIFLFATSVAIGESFIQKSDFSKSIIFVLCIAGFFNIMNLFLTNYGFDKVKVAIAANLLTLEIVFALGYGIVLYSEFPTVREWIGGAIIVLSVLMVNKIENNI